MTGPTTTSPCGRLASLTCSFALPSTPPASVVRNTAGGVTMRFALSHACAGTGSHCETVLCEKATLRSLIRFGHDTIAHAKQAVDANEVKRVAAKYLQKDQIAILKRWIEGGLLENSNSSAKKPGKPKFAATLQTDPASRPDGPPPMPMHLLLEPQIGRAHV